MTPNTPDESEQDWEFKILRAQCGEFASRRRRQQILDMEAKAGWMLVEIFDSWRIRLKRPATAKLNDHQLDFDPYRTVVDAGPLLVGLIAVLGVVAVISVGVAVIMVHGR